jgi:hypothetical protein
MLAQVAQQDRKEYKEYKVKLAQQAHRVMLEIKGLLDRQAQQAQ